MGFTRTGTPNSKVAQVNHKKKPFSSTIITTINETVSQLLPPYAAHDYTMLIPKALVVCSATLAIVRAHSGSDFAEESTASISFLKESTAPSARWVLVQGGEIGGETASATPVKGPGLHQSESHIEIHIHISSVPSEVELKDLLHNAVHGSIASLTGQRQPQLLQSAPNAHHESIQAAPNSKRLLQDSFFALKPALHILAAVVFIVSALAVLDPCGMKPVFASIVKTMVIEALRPYLPSPTSYAGLFVIKFLERWLTLFGELLYAKLSTIHCVSLGDLHQAGRSSILWAQAQLERRYSVHYTATPKSQVQYSSTHRLMSRSSSPYGRPSVRRTDSSDSLASLRSSDRSDSLDSPPSYLSSPKSEHPLCSSQLRTSFTDSDGAPSSPQEILTNHLYLQLNPYYESPDPSLSHSSSTFVLPSTNTTSQMLACNPSHRKVASSPN